MSSSTRKIAPKGYGGVKRSEVRFTDRVQRQQDVTGATSMVDPFAGARTAQIGPASIPGYYYPKQSKSMQDVHYRFQAEAGVTDGFKRDFEQRDIKVLEEMREARMREAYDQWLVRRFNTSDIHVARWLRKIEPEFWERRQAWQNDKTNINNFLTRMRLYGPSTLEDLQGIATLSNGEMGTDITQVATPWIEGNTVAYVPGVMAATHPAGTRAVTDGARANNQVQARLYN